MFPGSMKHQLWYADKAIRDEVWQILLPAGTHDQLLKLYDGTQLADVLLSPASQSALTASRSRIAALSPQIEALLFGA